MCLAATHIDVALVRVLPHGSNEGPGHGSGGRTGNRGVSRRLIVRAAGKHPDVFSLAFPVLTKVLGCQAIRVGIPSVVQTVEEIRSTTQEHPRVLDPVHGEASLEEMLGRDDQADALLHLVHHVHVAILIGPEHIGEFAGGARVTAVKEDRKPCLWVEGRYDCLVELAA